MFCHVMVGSNNIEASKKFYDALFTAAGGSAGTVDAKGRVAYSQNGARFLVTKPINGQAATSANGGTIGFTIKDPRMAEPRWKILRACGSRPARRSIWPICGTPTATSSAQGRLSPVKLGITKAMRRAMRPWL